MSWYVVGAIVVSTAATAYSQKQASKAQQIEIDRQAEEEKLQSKTRELQRRQRLNKVLAANQVSMSASGMSGEGTPSSISLESAKQASISEGAAALSDRLRQAQLDRQSKNVRRTGNLQATSTLLQGASSIATYQNNKGS